MLWIIVNDALMPYVVKVIGFRLCSQTKGGKN